MRLKGVMTAAATLTVVLCMLVTATADQVVLNDVEGGEDAVRAVTHVRRWRESYSGHVRVDDINGGHLFYWLWEARNGNRDAPVIVWFLGGPGAPSSVYVFLCLGPYQSHKIDGDVFVAKNPWTWNQDYAMVFLDQPVGVGFSYVKEPPRGYVNSDEEAAAAAAYGLSIVMERYNKRRNHLYLFGESYAGKYIPFTATEILKQNKERNILNLKGFGIGDGWVDPENQLTHYSGLMYESGYIGKKQRDHLYQLEQEAVELIREGKHLEAYDYVDDQGHILSTLFNYTGFTNPYNFDMGFDLDQYFQSIPVALEFLQVIKDELHIGNHYISPEWGGMNFDVYNRFKPVFTKSARPLIPQLLKSGLRVLFYHGQYDLIVPYRGQESWISKIADDDFSEGFIGAPKEIWRLSENGSPAGYVKVFANVTEVMFRKAGHMVIKDKPEEAYNMMKSWIEGKSLSLGPQPAPVPDVKIDVNGATDGILPIPWPDLRAIGDGAEVVSSRDTLQDRFRVGTESK